MAVGSIAGRSVVLKPPCNWGYCLFLHHSCQSAHVFRGSGKISTRTAESNVCDPDIQNFVFLIRGSSALNSFEEFQRLVAVSYTFTCLYSSILTISC